MKNKVKIEKMCAYKVGTKFQKKCPAWLWTIIEKDVERFYSDYASLVNIERDKIDEAFDKRYPNYKFEEDNGEKPKTFYGDYYKAILIYSGLESKNLFIDRWFITEGNQLGFKTIFGTKYEIGFMSKSINALYEI